MLEGIIRIQSSIYDRALFKKIVNKFAQPLSRGELSEAPVPRCSSK